MGPILVTGAPRSGTSIVSRTIATCGAWSGTVNSLWENWKMRDTVLKPLLRSLGADPLGMASFPPADAPTDGADDFRERVLAIRDAQGYDGGPWVWKDAKLCLVNPLIAAAFPDAVWVTVWRPAEWVAQSIRNSSFMNPPDADAVVGTYHDRSERIDGIRVEPQSLNDLREMVDALGLEWSPEVETFYRPERWHG